jgi:hypothetical protein
MGTEQNTKTQELWRKLYNADLTDEQAREINDSAVKFFSLLADWAKKVESEVTTSENHNNLKQEEPSESIDQRRAS